jgi:hypothetical protein
MPGVNTVVEQLITYVGQNLRKVTLGFWCELEKLGWSAQDLFKGGTSSASARRGTSQQSQRTSKAVSPRSFGGFIAARLEAAWDDHMVIESGMLVRAFALETKSVPRLDGA